MKTMGVTEVKIKGEDQHLVLSRDALEHALKEGTVEALYKFGVYDREPSLRGGKRIEFQGDFLKEGRPTAQSVISSVEIDRDGDIVESSGGVITENFMRNPVVLPSHMHSFPVGFDQAVVQTDSLIWAKWQWTSDLPDTQGAIYQRLWEAHALNCTSIGFIIVEWSKPEEIPGWKFIEWELLEHSPVVIPSNREAMRTDSLKSFLKGYAEAVMEGPSPLVKQLVDENRELFLPKQLQVGAVGDKEVVDKVKMEEEPEVKATTIGEAAVTIKVNVEEASPDAEIQASLPFSENKGVITYAAAHPNGTPKADEDEAWDGAAERSAAEVADLKVMCSWVDSENDDTKGAYKLPHHKASGKAVVWKGVSAAMGALLGARGGVDIPDDDRKGVYGHLKKHYAEFDKEPPEFKELAADELFKAFPEQYVKLMAEEDWKENLDHLCSAWSAGTLSKREFVFLVRLLVTSSNEAVRQQAEELEDVVSILAAHIVVHQ